MEQGQVCEAAGLKETSHASLAHRSEHAWSVGISVTFDTVDHAIFVQRMSRSKGVCPTDFAFVSTVCNRQCTSTVLYEPPAPYTVESIRAA